MTRLAVGAPPAHRPPPPAGPPSVTPAADRPVGYFEASAYPLTSLLFVVPLIVAYEYGTRWWASDPVSHAQQRIVAFNLMQQFFALWGVSGQYMPAGAVASILIAWHLARGDRFAARPSVLAGMVLESGMYAVPLVALGYAFQHYLPLYSVRHPIDSHKALLVLSIGAGIYEELVFRLVAFNVLSFLLIDLLRWRRGDGRTCDDPLVSGRLQPVPLQTVRARPFRVAQLRFPGVGGGLFRPDLRLPRVRPNGRCPCRLRRGRRPAPGGGADLRPNYFLPAPRPRPIYFPVSPPAASCDAG